MRILRHFLGQGSLLLICLLVQMGAWAQPNIVRVEYFIDTDPGFGNAISIPVSASPNLAEQQANINLSGVSEGIHQFYLRSQDANGNWSVTNRLTFYRIALGTSQLPNLSKAEYFIDTDPGFGNGVSIPLASTANVQDQSVVVDIGSVPEGIHNLFIRSQDANGNWSVPGVWSNGLLPDASTPVVIRHTLFLDIDGSCKKLTVEPTGELRINPNRRLTVLKE